MSIVVVGSINADLVVRCDRVPQAGETLTGTGFETGVGGKGLNQCAALALLSNAHVSMVGCIGHDAHGDMCLAALEAVNVDVKLVTRTKEATGNAIILVEADGNNRIILTAGANALLSETCIDGAENLLTSADLVVFQLESPIDTIHYALQKVQPSNTKTLLNPAPAITLPDEILRLVDYLIPNETEAAILTGRKVVTIEDALKAGTVLLSRGVRKAVIITLGAQGCVLVTKDDQQHIPAEKTNVVDTTAAGDSFIGAFAARLMDGVGLKEAVEYGNKVAAITVSRAGAMKSIPSRVEVEER